MTKKIRVTALYNKEPVIRLYVLALIELARQIQAEDEQRASQATSPKLEQGKAEDPADA